MPRGTVIGHVHLHVGDLPMASDFFGDATDAIHSGSLGTRLRVSGVQAGSRTPPPRW